MNAVEVSPGADRYLTLPAGTLRARVHGEVTQPLAIGVPGLSANCFTFGRLGAAVAGLQRCLVALDLRGRGRSPAGKPGSHGWAAHARDVLATADALGAERFDFIGHSMGAFVGLTLMKLAPMRVRSLTLIDAVGVPDARAMPPILGAAQRLGAVYPSAAHFLSLVQGVGVVPWDSFWQAHYTEDLGGDRGRRPPARLERRGNRRPPVRRHHRRARPLAARGQPDAPRARGAALRPGRRHRHRSRSRRVPAHRQALQGRRGARQSLRRHESPAHRDKPQRHLSLADINRVIAGNLDGELWVDIDSTNRHQHAFLENVFRFHPLAVEDTLNPNSRVKLEEYPGYLFVIVRGVRFLEETDDPYDLETFNLYFFLGTNFLVTVHGEPSPSDHADVTDRLERNPDLLESAAPRG